jgi:DNA-binding MurR/RpiR family transcriptional regulator
MKAELIVKLKKAVPEMSTRAIAAATGMSKSTVARVASAAGVPGGATVRGRDGKTYPGQRKRPRVRLDDDHPGTRKKATATAQTASKTKPKSQQRDQAIIDFSNLLHRRFEATLEDFVNILADETKQASGLPTYKRQELAQKCLAVLNVAPTELSGTASPPPRFLH